MSTMKVIIAGSRKLAEVNDPTERLTDERIETIIELRKQRVFDCISSLLSPLHTDIEVVSGRARGADRWGEEWSGKYGYIPPAIFEPDWNKYGKAAGFLRNVEMADYADSAILFFKAHIDESKGTVHMMDILRKKQMPFSVFYI